MSFTLASTLLYHMKVLLAYHLQYHCPTMNPPFKSQTTFYQLNTSIFPMFEVCHSHSYKLIFYFRLSKTLWKTFSNRNTN